MDRATNEALNSLYEATVDPLRWPGALHKLAGTVGAAGCILIPRDPTLIEAGFPVSAGIEEVMSAFVADGWHRRDVRADRGWPLLAGGRQCLVEDDLTTPEERARSPYHQELFRPFGLPWWGGVGFDAHGGKWCLTIIRGSGQGAFEKRDLAPLAEIAPHLSRLVNLAFSVRSQLDDGVVSSADLGRQAVVLLDRKGRITRASAEALRLLGDFRVVEGRLRARSASEDRALQALISSVLVGGKASGQRPRWPVLLSRDDVGKVIVEACPLPEAARDVFRTSEAILTLRPLGRQKRRATSAAGAFALTAAETALVEELYMDSDLRNVARKMRISYETARWHLKNVFPKMGVTRQADLLVLIESF